MKTALVTGGTVRLGKAIADRLAADGWRVLTSSHRPDAGADIVADLSDPTGSVRLYAEALKLLEGAPPDALVNNAALFTGDDAQVEAVNLEAPRKLTMLMAGRETGIAAVVNILDADICFAETAVDGAYARSKRELGAFTRKAALMFSDNLRVNAVAPGAVIAPVALHVKAGEIPLARRPTARDVAAAVSFLLNAESTTGAIIPVDSGRNLLLA